MSPEVLLVEDDDAVRDSIEQSLMLAGLAVRGVAKAKAALELIGAGLDPWVVISDVRLGGMDGLELLRRLHEGDAERPVVLITGHGDVPMAVQAMRDGAHDFIEKPFAPARLVSVTTRAIAQRRLVLENRALRQRLGQDDGWGLVGQSPAMRELRRLIGAVGPTRADVLLFGETGTGKEVVARALHAASGRGGPFVAINCGALPETVFESEVFGHEAGAFTGAQKRRIGRFEHARGGTVFLDEIETMPLALQAKLLRVLQERCVERLGSNEPVPIDCRVVAATKVDLAEAAAQGRFREDLYYRLEVVTLRLPPLRERLEDVALLFAHFLAAAAQRHGVTAPPFGPDDVVDWQQRAWPGNVRELRNLAERWSLGLGRPAAGPSRGALSLAETMARAERTCIEQALEATVGNVAAAAERLDLPKKTLYDKLTRLGIDPARFRGA